MLLGCAVVRIDIIRTPRLERRHNTCVRPPQNQGGQLRTGGDTQDITNAARSRRLRHNVSTRAHTAAGPRASPKQLCCLVHVSYTLGREPNTERGREPAGATLPWSTNQYTRARNADSWQLPGHTPPHASCNATPQHAPGHTPHAHATRTCTHAPLLPTLCPPVINERRWVYMYKPLTLRCGVDPRVCSLLLACLLLRPLCRCCSQAHAGAGAGTPSSAQLSPAPSRLRLSSAAEVVGRKQHLIQHLQRTGRPGVRQEAVAAAGACSSTAGQAARARQPRTTAVMHAAAVMTAAVAGDWPRATQ